jgi:hypothetical protein
MFLGSLLVGTLPAVTDDKELENFKTPGRWTVAKQGMSISVL